MKKYTNKELFEMDAVEVYKLVLRGDIKTFPRGFWMQPEAKQNVAKCVKFLIEDILNLSDEELKEQLSVKLLKKYKLNGMIDACFGNSAIKAIDAAYPGKFRPWEFKVVSVGYWTDVNNGIKATKWLIEEKLKLSDEELKEQLSAKIFKENCLKGMLSSCFNSSPYEAINATYPGKFKPWEFKIAPTGYWNDINNAKIAIKWLIEEKLKLTDEELKEQLSLKIFIDNGLGSMMSLCFNSSPYEAINLAYPGKFKPWEFRIVPKRYWNDTNNIIESVKWLVEEKLQLTDEQLKEELSVSLFVDNGLYGMINNYFNGSPYEAINIAYPGKFKKEDFKNYR